MNGGTGAAFVYNEGGERKEKKQKTKERPCGASTVIKTKERKLSAILKLMTDEFRIERKKE